MPKPEASDGQGDLRRPATKLPELPKPRVIPDRYIFHIGMFARQREKMIGRYVYAAHAGNAMEHRAAECHASAAVAFGGVTVAGRE